MTGRLRSSGAEGVPAVFGSVASCGRALLRDYRTSVFADGIGWNLTRNLQVLNTAIKEQVGHLAYRLTGR